MRVSFWPDGAWTYLVGQAWPWLTPGSLPGDGYAQQLRAALVPHWQQRLGLVPPHILSERTRDRMAAALPSIGPAQVGALGFEKAVAAMQGDGQALWFFDLGSGAWCVALERILEDRLYPATAVPPGLSEAVGLWRSAGPVAAAQRLDQMLEDAGVPLLAPVAALYRAPLALWQDHDAARACELLDAALQGMPQVVRRSLGLTLPLTYALVLRLLGREAEALEHLTGPGAEVAYQRARMLWDRGDETPAIAAFVALARQDASYALRAFTDPAIREGATPARFDQLVGAMSAVVSEVHAALARFQQSRTEEDTLRPVVRELDELLAFSSSDPAILLAGGTLLARIQEARAAAERVGPAFRAELARLQEYAAGLPNGFDLRLGAGYAQRFRGPDSDLTRLEALLAREDYDAAAAFVADLTQDLPLAARAGLFNHRRRLGLGLTTSAEVLLQGHREEHRPRFELAADLAQRCLDLGPALEDIPSTLGRDALYKVQKAWEALADIERDWVRSEARALGQMRLILPQDVRTVPAGGFSAIQVQVVDAAGQPVAGVPVVWRVASGSARGKDESETLENEWALSLATGVAYLAIAMPERGGGGELAVSLLGGYAPGVVRYEPTFA